MRNFLKSFFSIENSAVLGANRFVVRPTAQSGVDVPFTKIAIPAESQGLAGKNPGERQLAVCGSAV